MEDEAAIIVVEQGNLLAARDGRELVERATERATALAEVIRKQKLSTNISGREHVRVEGWALLGSMMGVFPVTDWVHEIRDAAGAVIGFEARVAAQTLAGATVGAAIARCMRSEDNWGAAKGTKGYRDDFALMSMAQTRATSKALRMPLGFVMQLAGFDPTPAEEMGKEPAVVEQNPEREARNVALKALNETITGEADLVTHAKTIASRLGIESLREASTEQIEAVHAALLRFTQTGEMPPEPAQEPEEPAEATQSLAERLSAAAAFLTAEDDDTSERRKLLEVVAEIAAELEWSDDDVKAILGSRRRDTAKALASADLADLRLAVDQLEAACKDLAVDHD